MSQQCFHVPGFALLVAQTSLAMACRYAPSTFEDVLIDVQAPPDYRETAVDADSMDAGLVDSAVGEVGSPTDISSDLPDGYCPMIVRDVPVLRSDAPSGLGAPRLLFPLSTNRVTSQRPTLRWELPPEATGARIELCRDRGCLRPITTLVATGTSVRPEGRLEPGVVFWRTTSMRGTELGIERSHTWEFLVGHQDAIIDTAWGTLHDFNGDGYDDLAVSALYLETGQIMIYHGSSDGLGREPAVVLHSPDGAAEEFGFRLLPGGDINGDGFADLVVGENPLGSTRNRFMIYLGSPSSIHDRPDQIILLADCSFVNKGPRAAGTDLNGDGFTDVILSGSTVDLHIGTSEGLSVRPISRFSTFSRISSVAVIGDVSGDGFGDIAEWSDGIVVLHRGQEDGLESSPLTLIGGGYQFPTSAGDVDGDGIGDLVLNRSGVLNIFRGRRTGSFESAQIIMEPTFSLSPGEFGTQYATVGDINHDGRPDLLMGSMTAPVDPVRRLRGLGQAYVFLGQTDGGLMATPASVLELERDWHGQQFGIGTSGGRDFNGDGWDDVVVGACCADRLDIREFFAVYYGMATGLETRARYTIDILSRTSFRTTFGVRFALSWTKTTTSVGS